MIPPSVGVVALLRLFSTARTIPVATAAPPTMNAPVDASPIRPAEAAFAWSEGRQWPAALQPDFTAAASWSAIAPVTAPATSAAPPAANATAVGTVRFRGASGGDADGLPDAASARDPGPPSFDGNGKGTTTGILRPASAEIVRVTGVAFWTVTWTTCVPGFSAMSSSSAAGIWTPSTRTFTRASGAPGMEMLTSASCWSIHRSSSRATRFAVRNCSGASSATDAPTTS